MAAAIIPAAGVVEGVAKTVGSLASLVGGRPSSGSIAHGVIPSVVQSAVNGNMAAAYVLDFRSYRGVVSEKTAWAQGYQQYASQAPAMEAQYRALKAQYAQGLQNGPFLLFISPTSGGYPPGTNGYSPDTTTVAQQALSVPWFPPKSQASSPNASGVTTVTGASNPLSGAPAGVGAFLGTVPTWVWIVLAVVVLMLVLRR